MEGGHYEATEYQRSGSSRSEIMTQNEFNQKKVMLYSIGAGTIVLALMAFSGACWGVVRACDGKDEASLEFWEVFGVSAAAFMATMAVRSAGLGRKRSVKPSPPGTVPDQRIGVVRSAQQQQQGLQAPVSLHSMGPLPSPNGSWRDLYSQLSEEERQEMKALLGKYCNGVGPDGNAKKHCANVAASNPTNGHPTPAQAANNRE